MIKQITEPFEAWDSLSARVLASWQSYDSHAWLQHPPPPPLAEGGLAAVISIVDGFAVLAANENANWEELGLFLRMQPWSRLQCESQFAANLPFETEWASLIMRFASAKMPPAASCRIASDPAIACDILTQCDLNIKNRNDWMADLALRWRRGTAKTWLLDDICTGSAVAIAPGHVYIGAVGTLPEHRGQGHASRLVAHICAYYHGREAWLSCREGLGNFYGKIGFEIAGEMSTLTKEKP